MRIEVIACGRFHAGAVRFGFGAPLDLGDGPTGSIVVKPLIVNRVKVRALIPVKLAILGLVEIFPKHGISLTGGKDFMRDGPAHVVIPKFRGLASGVGAGDDFALSLQVK